MPVEGTPLSEEWAPLHERRRRAFEALTPEAQHVIRQRAAAELSSQFRNIKLPKVFVDARAYELMDQVEPHAAPPTVAVPGDAEPQGRETSAPERAGQFVRWAAQVHGVSPHETPATGEQMRARALAWTVLRSFGLGARAISRLYGVHRRRVQQVLGQTAREPSAQEAAARWRVQFLDLVEVRRS